MNCKFCVAVLLGILLIVPLSADDKAKIVLISGTPSHGRLQHEHRAGNLILAEALNTSGLKVDAVVAPASG
jgi:hypothetical protein